MVLLNLNNQKKLFMFFFYIQYAFYIIYSKAALAFYSINPGVWLAKLIFRNRPLRLSEYKGVYVKTFIDRENGWSADFGGIVVMIEVAFSLLGFFFFFVSLTHYNVKPFWWPFLVFGLIGFLFMQLHLFWGKRYLSKFKIIDNLSRSRRLFVISFGILTVFLSLACFGFGVNSYVQR